MQPYRISRRSAILGLGAATLTLAGSGSAQAAPAIQTFKPYWIQNHAETELWSGLDRGAVPFGTVPANGWFRVIQPPQGERLLVENPLDGGKAWIPAWAVGPSGEPPAWYANAAKITKRVPARIIGGANVRTSPEVVEGNILDKLAHNEGVEVLSEVVGPDGGQWVRIGDRQFVHGELVRQPSPFPAHPGRVIVAELSEPVLVTAYENAKPVYSAMALKGTTKWETPTGFFTIIRRVANETMDSRTLNIPREGPGGYYLKDVLFTQYFAEDGASIHYNYWSSNFGYSGSHGCLGMNYEDSLWFWHFAEIGTPLIIRE